MCSDRIDSFKLKINVTDPIDHYRFRHKFSLLFFLTQSTGSSNPGTINAQSMRSEQELAQNKKSVR